MGTAGRNHLRNAASTSARSAVAIAPFLVHEARLSLSLHSASSDGASPRRPAPRPRICSPPWGPSLCRASGILCTFFFTGPSPSLVTVRYARRGSPLRREPTSVPTPKEGPSTTSKSSPRTACSVTPPTRSGGGRRAPALRQSLGRRASAAGLWRGLLAPVEVGDELAQHARTAAGLAGAVGGAVLGSSSDAARITGAR